MNTWPGGNRRAMSQDEHERWNASNYPGTRQLCSKCGEPTGRCEDDSLHDADGEGPVCLECVTHVLWIREKFGVNRETITPEELEELQRTGEITEQCSCGAWLSESFTCEFGCQCPECRQ